MAITEADIREVLPMGSAVPSRRIEAAIAAWSQLVTLRVGSALADSPAADEIVRLGAGAAALDYEQSMNAQAATSPVGDDRRSQAMRLLDAFDAASSAPGEEGAVNAGLVSNPFSTPLFDADTLSRQYGISQDQSSDQSWWDGWGG